MYIYNTTYNFLHSHSHLYIYIYIYIYIHFSFSFSFPFHLGTIHSYIHSHIHKYTHFLSFSFLLFLFSPFSLCIYFLLLYIYKKADYENKLNLLQNQLYEMECEQRCCVCLTNNRNVIYQCGHRVVCDECDVSIADRSNTWAICRADVISRVQHF